MVLNMNKCTVMIDQVSMCVFAVLSKNIQKFHFQYVMLLSLNFCASLTNWVCLHNFERFTIFSKSVHFLLILIRSLFWEFYLTSSCKTLDYLVYCILRYNVQEYSWICNNLYIYCTCVVQYNDTLYNSWSPKVKKVWKREIFCTLIISVRSL